MYKVFVDNVPIYFQKSSSFKSNIPERFLPSLPLNHFEDFTKEINVINSNEKVLINSPDPADEIKSFFKHFQWIEAAGGIIRNRKTNQLLFIFRNGVWDIPKGKIEDGENPREAAIREIEEECGVKDGRIEYALSPTYHIYFAYGRHWIKKTYWFALTNNDISVQPQQEEGITAVKWIPDNQLDTIRANTFGSILDVIEEYMRLIK